MSDHTIRRGGPADAPAVDALTQAAYAKWVPIIGRKPRPMLAEYAAAVVEHRIDLVEIDGQLAALVELDQQPDHLLIVNLAVHPDHQRQGLTYRSQQARRVWHEPPQPAADAIHVGIMGFGTLGRAAAKALLALGFKVNGWSRSAHSMPDVATFHGPHGLDPFLRSTDILVSLLPLTAATRGIIDYALLGKLNRDNALGGAFLVNAGRGRLQKDMDIVRALDDGLIKEASLDVFETEPLPPKSPLWPHPKVFVTPHAAATSDPIHLVPPMLAQMDAFERGEKLQNLVDRNAGY